jgi:hypothetical protein
MRKKLLISFCLVVLTMLPHTAICQTQDKLKDVVAEGTIVAFQRRTRHRVKPDTKGIATYVELWIVRIDKWLSKSTENEKYILVKYELSERGISDDEINSQRLKFVLRAHQEKNDDCLGTVLVGDSPPYQERPINESDYERTKSGESEIIPPLQNLPCFSTERPPIVIE